MLHTLETHLAFRMLGSARKACGPPGKSLSLPRNISVTVCLFMAQKLGNLGFSQSTCTCGHRPLYCIRCIWKRSAFWFCYGNKNAHQECPKDFSPKPESEVISQALHNLYPAIYPPLIFSMCIIRIQ